MCSVINTGGWVLDSLDIETFVACESEAEAKRLVLGFLEGLGFVDIDVVFAEYMCPGARVRARVSLHRPGADYPWLLDKGAGEEALDGEQG